MLTIERPAAPIQTKPKDRRELPEEFPVGRPCAEPGCGYTLCRYNPTDRCWSHGVVGEDVELPEAA